MNFKNLIFAFRFRGYRWLWLSSLFGSAGFAPYMMAEGWLLLELTNSPLMVGLAPGIGSVASMLVGPFGGVLVDRLDRRKVLIVTQGLMAGAALVLGVLAVSDVIEVWHILVVSPVHRITIGLQMAARNTLMYDVVGREGAMNAMAGQFMSSHSASVIGPLAGGFLMAAYGPGALLTTVGVVISLGCVSVLRVPAVAKETPSGSMLANLRDGIRYAVGNRSVRSILWTVLITDGLGFSTQAMFPVVTRDLLHGGPIVLGLLAAMRGLGGVVGAVILLGFGDTRAKGWLFFGSAILFGIFLIVFSVSTVVLVSLILIFLAGAVATAYDTMAHTLLQMVSPENMRGRMMGLYAFVVSGIGYGALLQGAVATLIGVTWAISLSGGTIIANGIARLPISDELGRRSSGATQSPK